MFHFRLTKLQPSMVIVMLFSMLILSVSTAGAIPPQQTAVSNSLPENVILQLTPDANLKAVVQLLADLQAKGEITDFRPGPNGELRVQTNTATLALLGQIPGVAQVVSLSSQPAVALDAAQSDASFPNSYWLMLQPNQAAQALPLMLQNLARLQADGVIQQFRLTNRPNIIQVVADSDAQDKLQAIPGVWITDDLSAMSALADSSAADSVSRQTRAIGTETPTDVPQPTQLPTDVSQPTQLPTDAPTTMPKPTDTPTITPLPTKTMPPTPIGPTPMPTKTMPPTPIGPTPMPTKTMPPTPIGPTPFPTKTPFPSPTPLPTLEPGAIAGRVTTQVDGTPLANIKVCARPAWVWKCGQNDLVKCEIPGQSTIPNWDMGSCADTNANGEYLIQQLTVADYQVEFADTSGTYLTEYYNHKFNPTEADFVTVVAKETVKGIDAALGTGGHLSGTVTNSEGQPLKGISVEIYRSQENWWWVWVASTTTDETGHYDVGSLPSGAYQVGFSDWTGGYFTEYYNDVLCLEQAIKVNVVAGQTTANIDASLARGGHLSGKVTSGDGTPLAGITVQVRQKIEGNWKEWGSWVVTNAEGHYDVGGLGSGIYRVCFFTYPSPLNSQPSPPEGKYMSQCYDGAPNFESAKDISVTSGQTVKDINAVLLEGGHISGKVVTADGQPVPNVSVEVYQNKEACQCGGWQWVGSSYTNEMGQYEVVGLPNGTYRVGFFSWGDHQKIVQFYKNAFDLKSATDVTVKAGETITGIDAVLTDPSGHIAGRVTNPDGKPVPGISILVYRPQYGRWEAIGKAMTAEDGRYDVGMLNSGIYRVGFFDGKGHFMPVYFKDAPNLDAAIDVVVTGGKTTNDINAVLNSGGGIKGIVTNEANGKPLGKTKVCAMPVKSEVKPDTTNDPANNWGNCAPTNELGVYEIVGLLGGDYVVQFQPNYEGFTAEFYNNKLSWDEADKVTVVAGKTTEGISAALAVGSAISGLVTDQADNQPLGKIWVCANPLNGGPRQCNPTDEKGLYLLSGLRPGKYVVEFWDQQGRYLNEFYDNQTDVAQANAVVVTAGQTTSAINAALSTGGHIAGTVTDINGKAVSGIVIEVYGSEPKDTPKDLWNWNGLAKTDEDGHYDVGGLKNGYYRVGFFDWSGKYVNEYYNDAPTLETAAKIVVTIGQKTEQVDAVLSTGGRITGQITSASGEPLEAVSIELYQYRGDKWKQLNPSFTDSKGNYELNGLANGKYRLHFVDWNNAKPMDEKLPHLTRYASEFYNDVANLESATDIVIANGQTVADINASLSDGGHVSGNVTDSDGKAIAHVDVEVFQKKDDKWVREGLASTDKEGKYDVAGLNSGTYRLGFFDKSGHYAYEFYNDAADLDQATGVEVKVGSTVTDINAVLAKAATPLIDVKQEGGHVKPDPHTGEVIISQQLHHRKDVKIIKENICTNGQKPVGEILLKMSTISNTMSYPLNEKPLGSGRYETTIPSADLVDGAKLTLLANCGDGTPEQKVGQIILYKYDPSGLITDAKTKQPVDQASVTLYKVPGWKARESAGNSLNNTCESNLSKDKNSAWSQQAPTDLGVVADPNAGEIDPALNPFITETDGYYGWDVTEGCWYVTVEADGYETLTSPVVGVPPAVTDLNLSITPTGNPVKDASMTVYLPIVIK